MTGETKLLNRAFLATFHYRGFPFPDYRRCFAGGGVGICQVFLCIRNHLGLEGTAMLISLSSSRIAGICRRDTMPFFWHITGKFPLLMSSLASEAGNAEPWHSTQLFHLKKGKAGFSILSALMSKRRKMTKIPTRRECLHFPNHTVIKQLLY